MNQDLANISEKCTEFVENMEKSIIDIKNLMRGYSELFIRIEDTFGDDFDKEFKGVYAKKNLKMNNLIRELMDRIHEKKVNDVKKKDQNDREKNLQGEKSNARKMEQRIGTFIGISENIKERVALMESTCLISLDELSDSQILEKIQDSKMLDSEYNQILDWSKLVRPTTIKQMAF